MFMDGGHDSRAGGSRQKESSRLENLRRAAGRGGARRWIARIRGRGSGRERPVVVVVRVVDEDVELRAGVADGVAERIEALAGDRDGIALVPRLPHPLAPVTAHRFELDLHRRLSQVLHLLSPSPATCLRPAATRTAMPMP